ncbi:hypothetical protein B0I35DRAFT_382946 [Stachybotrys elegans]|uniref:Uncharacterized protein n=1 Tax=Stachybotrys elegans TaxID=80388 RepID=A0A8K0WL64_9HYPO|nr:hypothetical protein B0I35DRAFT_382946 [Stachybotrys elegans]
MPGTLIPPWFVPNVPTCEELVVASVTWGVSLGLSIFGLLRAGDQTLAHWRRARRVTDYMVYIWLELAANSIGGGLSWGFMCQDIPPSLWYFTGMILLWCFQVHCIMQIILTRITLITDNMALVRRVKWGVFIAVLLINISVACIWIPARLQRSQEYIRINDVWDRAEKAILAVIDLGLNAYFVYLVRSSLISYGLKKYVRLYRFNLVMICISMTMDVLLIGYMSLSNTFLYLSFHALAYLVKLHIEMTMADLIGKIVKASSRGNTCFCPCHVSTTFTDGYQDLLGPQQQQQRQQDPQQAGVEKINPTLGCFRRA